MWMLHFLSHLKDGGTAGFVMATGELSNSQIARLEVRKALVEGGYVDCIVQLSGQLFANTQIPCTLWFLSKNRNGEKGFRPRIGEILFIDARKLGMLIPGSRKQKELSEADLELVAAVYCQFKRTGAPEAVPGFCRVAEMDEVIEHKYALTPGRYVGSSNGDDVDEEFEEKMSRLVKMLEKQLDESVDLDKEIRKILTEVGYGE
jgi:type I restriction enzyme M protein